MAAPQEEGLPPPGARVETLRAKCTACQACVAACRNGVLVAAGGEYGITGMMMPRMVFTKGYCTRGCTRCGEVCPTGAIRPFSVQEKKNLVCGRAVWAKESCVVVRDGLACGNCAKHCPYQAVTMVAGDKGRKVPQVDPGACVGCGACEYHCPTKAIRVGV